MSVEKIPTLRDFFIILFKYKYGIFFLFLIVVSTVTVFTYIWPFTFEASAKILVKFDRETVPLSRDSQNPKPILTMRPSEEEILSEIEIMNNRYLIDKVVKELWEDLTFTPVEEPTSTWAKIRTEFKMLLGRAIDYISEIGYYLGLIQRLPPFEAQVAKVIANLRIEPIRDSSIIEIKYRSWYPSLCAKIVNAFTGFYLNHHIEVHKIPRAHKFFLEQQERLDKNLRDKEESLSDFKKQWDISSIDVQKKLLLENLSMLTMDNKILQSTIEETKIRIDRLKFALSQRTNYIETESIPIAILSSDPMYKVLEKDILTNGSNLEALKAKNQLQLEQLEDYRSQIRTLEGKQIELKRRERELDILEKDYKRYLSRLEDTRISEALDMERISNVSVIEPASIPFRPLRSIPFMPRRLLHISMGIILGLVVGIAYAFLAEQLDYTFNSGEDVERLLNIPCIASIPKE